MHIQPTPRAFSKAAYIVTVVKSRDQCCTWQYIPKVPHTSNTRLCVITAQAAAIVSGRWVVFIKYYRQTQVLLMRRAIHTYIYIHNALKAWPPVPSIFPRLKV